MELKSHLPIDKQIRTIGATWLDHQLVTAEGSASATGFGAAMREALNARVDFLIKEGLAQRRDGGTILAPNFMSTLRNREMHGVADSIQRQTGLSYRPAADGVRVSGTYRQSVTLASGRFAMLSDGLGFSLVPWRPVIEPAFGRTISAVVRDGAMSWQLGRQRGISR